MSTVRDFLKQILPPPVSTFLREISGLREMMERQERQTEALTKQLQELRRQLDALETETAAARQALSAKQEDIRSDLQRADQQRRELSQAVENVRRQSADSARYASEAVWAEIFNNAVSGSAWLKNTAFSPGRWAVGYPVLYVLYRTLNEVRPRRILELGLGQSTRMLAQYATANQDVEHIVVEHDPEWIRFFQNDFILSERTSIVQLDRETVPYKEAEAVRVFRDFKETFRGQKFDLILIDAPLGGDMKEYARIDVLGLLPDCLSEKFVMIMDDCERSGETHTVAEMRKCLEGRGITVAEGRYSGKKDAVLLCSKTLGFLTTM